MVCTTARPLLQRKTPSQTNSLPKYAEKRIRSHVQLPCSCRLVKVQTKMLPASAPHVFSCPHDVPDCSTSYNSNDILSSSVCTRRTAGNISDEEL